MKTITFRPLRRNKKTGKVIVASYMGWRKVATSDYNEFNLIVDDEYKGMPPDEFVHSHKGELLFWPTPNPADISVFDKHSPISYTEFCDSFGAKGTAIENHKGQILLMGVVGCDCDNVPAFAHYTADYLGSTYQKIDIQEWNPLTVETVVKWFGWFLYQLNNSRLQIGK